MTKPIRSRLPGETPEARRKRLRAHAVEIYGTNDVEFGDDAKLSEAGSGVWVQAWVWIDFEQEGEDKVVDTTTTAMSEMLKALEKIAARGPIEGYGSAGALRLRLVAMQSVARAAIAKANGEHA